MGFGPNWFAQICCSSSNHNCHCSSTFDTCHLQVCSCTCPPPYCTCPHHCHTRQNCCHFTCSSPLHMHLSTPLPHLPELLLLHLLWFDNDTVFESEDGNGTVTEAAPDFGET